MTNRARALPASGCFVLAVCLSAALVGCLAPGVHTKEAPTLSAHHGRDLRASLQQVDGHWLRVRDLSPLSAATELPPIVLVHGYGSRLEAWGSVQTSLAEHTRVVSYDMRGFGRSDKHASTYGVQAHARELTRLVRELGLDRPILVGHSYGAGVVMRAALDNPNEFLGAIFVSAFLFDEQMPTGFRWAQWSGMGEAMFSSFYREVPGEKFIFAFYDTDRLVSVEHLEEVKESMSLPGAVFAALETVRGMDYAHHQQTYHELAIPSLIIWGKNDRVTPFPHAVKLESMLSNTRLESIAACGHVPSLERPNLTTKHILAFLRSLP